MRIGVHLGPFWLSTSTHRRRRRRSRRRQPSRPRQPRLPTWNATGTTYTPDGREVEFTCQHSHHTQDAAIKCCATVRKQIEAGQSQHLITRVRSTPASREAARQREAAEEAHRQARAAEQEARRQAKAARRTTSAPYPAQQVPRPAPPQVPSAPYPAQEGWPPTVPPQPRSRRWPVIGLITSGAAVILSIVIGVAAGAKPHTPLDNACAGIFALGIIGIVVFAIAALVQRLRRRKNGGLPLAPAVGYPLNAYPAPGSAAADPQQQSAHTSWPPGQESTQWPS